MAVQGKIIRIGAMVLPVLLGLGMQANAAPPTPDQINSFVQASGMTGLSPNQMDVLTKNITAEDVDGYVKFTQSYLGKRYLSFNKEVAVYFNDALKSIITKQFAGSDPLMITREQYANYQRMLMTSSAFQTLQHLNVQGQTEVGPTGMLMVGFVLQKFPQQLGDLYYRYADNLDAFDSYNKSQLAQDIFDVTLKVTQQEMKDKATATAH